MKVNISFLFLIFGAVSTSASARFLYDPARGTCIDESGKVGLNSLDSSHVFDNPILTPSMQATFNDGNGECLDLRGFNFKQFAKQHHYTGYMLLLRWNLKGADLSDANLGFVTIFNGKLDGAKLASARFGYSTLGGTVDDHTQLPDFCLKSNGTVECRR